MKKTLTICTAGLFFVVGAANAISMNADVGQHYTNLSAGLGTSSMGLAFSGNWLRSDHDGNLAALGLSYSLPVGPVMMTTMGGKVMYLDPHEGKKGAAVALGGGINWGINRYFTLYGEGYYAPPSLTSGVDSYLEAAGGVRWNVFSPFSVDLGYRYASMKGKTGYRNNTLADGPYLGMNLSF